MQFEFIHYNSTAAGARQLPELDSPSPAGFVVIECSSCVLVTICHRPHYIGILFEEEPLTSVMLASFEISYLFWHSSRILILGFQELSDADVSLIPCLALKPV